MVLYLGSVNPKTQVCIRPSELKSAEFRSVTGTAIFNRSISPPLGKKLLMNGFPFANGFPFFPVANWYGLKLGTPVLKMGYRSTERGEAWAGNRRVPKTASSKAVPVTADVPFNPYKPSWPLPKPNCPNEFFCIRNAFSAGTAPPNWASSIYNANSGL